MLLYVICFLVVTITYAQGRPLEAELNHVARECRQAEAEMSRVEEELGSVHSLYHQKNEHLYQQQQKIVRLLLLLKRLKTEAPARIIQSQQKSSNVLHGFSVLQCYIRSLHTQMQRLQEDLVQLHTTAQATSERKQALDQKVKNYQAKYEHLEKLLQQKKQQIQRTLSQRHETEQKAKKMAAQSSTLSDLVKQLQSAEKNSAVLLSPEKVIALAPVQGPLVANFGQKHLHSPDGLGVVFRSRAGSHVLAPISGQVLYAGPFRRYNNILIIGFKKNYSLLLTGLDRLDVSVGQEVKVGDPVARLPNNTKNYLYLELRHNGVPFKPNIMNI